MSFRYCCRLNHLLKELTQSTFFLKSSPSIPSIPSTPSTPLTPLILLISFPTHLNPVVAETGSDAFVQVGGASVVLLRVGFLRSRSSCAFAHKAKQHSTNHKKSLYLMLVLKRLIYLYIFEYISMTEIQAKSQIVKLCFYSMLTYLGAFCHQTMNQSFIIATNDWMCAP